MTLAKGGEVTPASEPLFLLGNGDSVLFSRGQASSFDVYEMIPLLSVIPLYLDGAPPPLEPAPPSESTHQVLHSI